MEMILIIIIVIGLLAIGSIIAYVFATKYAEYRAKADRITEQAERQKQIFEFYQEKNQLKEVEYQSLEKSIKEAQERKNKVDSALANSKEDLERTDENLIRLMDEYNDFLNNFNQSKEEYGNLKAELIENYEQEKKDKENELNKLKSTISAAMEVVRKQEIEEEEQKGYRLQISDNDLEDVQKLLSLTSQFHNPRALRMIIWSSYFQKETNNLCGRINVNNISGIYKITNILNKKVYIGQSVDISTRLKSHIKCGLGIDTPTTNQLYAAMLKDGIWNFTFELLEKCEINVLNECERKWIEIFSADTLGYNSTKGNK